MPCYPVPPISAPTANQCWKAGRTKEIQRLIGRALRSACDFTAFAEWQIRIDCDVIEADGGTRTTAINGAFVAMALCFDKMMHHNSIKKWPLRYHVAAISCGIIDDEIRLDLEYEEDIIAQTDANFVLNDAQKLIEVQSTAEKDPFDVTQLETMLSLAQQATDTIITLQKETLNSDRF